MKLLLRIKDDTIINRIYILRGQKVMLDKDLAELYGVATKRLKEQVKRNKARFPERYMFELTWEETVISRSQNASLKQGANVKHRPYAFTEHGILMLANVLKSGQAIQMSLRIIDVFVKMREALLNHKDILLKLQKLEQKMTQQDSRLTKHEKSIALIFQYVKKLLVSPPLKIERVGYKRKDEQ